MVINEWGREDGLVLKGFSETNREEVVVTLIKDERHEARGCLITMHV